MTIVLTPVEARVIGCLMEKEVTTPEHYPLSLNALTAACNQKSNRDPAMDLDEAGVQAVVDGLMKRHLVSDRAGYGGRVPKYRQSFCNTTFGSLQFTDLERAVLCELLLRGPQSAGELRTRCQRMTPVAEITLVDAALEALAVHAAGPFVEKLPRRSGARDPRWMHLLGGAAPAAEAESVDAAVAPVVSAATTSPQRPALVERVEHLEKEMAALRHEVAMLRGRLPPG